MVFYATLDSDGLRLHEGAEIVKFPTLEAAKAGLLGAFAPDDWDHSTAIIAPGEWGDAWLKVHSPVKVGDSMLSPFSRAQVRVRPPGTHPGGRQWWITPFPDVLVVAFIAPREE